jgi:hypothetical protein
MAPSPCKNLKIYGTKRLLDYSLDFALSTGQDTLISSDQDLSSTFDRDIKFHLRENQLADPSLSNFEVMRMMLGEFNSYDYICLLQPTHPLRSHETYVSMLNHLQDYPLNTPLVTVSGCWNQGEKICQDDKSLITGTFYFLRPEDLRRESLLKPGCFAFANDKDLVLDIDTVDDEKKFIGLLDSMSTSEMKKFGILKS